MKPRVIVTDDGMAYCTICGEGFAVAYAETVADLERSHGQCCWDNEGDGDDDTDIDLPWTRRAEWKKEEPLPAIGSCPAIQATQGWKRCMKLFGHTGGHSFTSRLHTEPMP